MAIETGFPSTELSIQATQALVQLPFCVQRLKDLETLPQLINPTAG
ncbi:hypothetical protein KR100_11225 [Synechococcus sp. KORDI-100]|nr:hypothetical protein KR100_11225 [Synechococcus sp. KORDI-100]